MDFKHLFLTLSFVYLTSSHESRQVHPDLTLNAKELIAKYEYPLEVHTVHTEDGYILETHRIPHGRSGQTNSTKSPILLMPGVLCSSDVWVDTGVEKSLGFILADLGYDVWLANYRGTTWSRKHETLNPNVDKKEFFNYSFQEIGAFDATANIDYILNVTQHESLYYIGHSQGTTTFFAMAAGKPQYNQKVKLMVALAPVAYVSHIDHILYNLFKRYYDSVVEFQEEYEVYEIARRNPLITLIVQVLCNDDSFYQGVCAELIYFIAGSSVNFDESLIPLIAGNAPAGASFRMLLHYVQMGMAKSFQRYDFGKKINLERYGQSTPPKFDLSQITAPVALYHSDKDPLATMKDVAQLNVELSNVASISYIDGYSHLDYLWADNVKTVVYDHVIQQLENYS